MRDLRGSLLSSRGHRSTRWAAVEISLVLGLLLTFVIAAWAGGDPWKTKPYQQWTMDDARQVLSDSPWARIQRVPMDWRSQNDEGSGKSVFGRAPGTAMEAQAAGASNPGGAGAGASGPGGNYDNGGLGGGPAPDYESPSMAGTPEGQTLFIVRWSSSRTIREALVRESVITNQMSAADGEQYLAQPASDYEVTVVGPDMTPFGTASEAELKEKTFLESKQSKVKVNPTNVLIQRTADGHRVLAVIFSFSRKGANGQPLISADDSNVKFTCKPKNLDLESGFDLRKMTNGKGADL
jgi:hypothetical protein